MDRSLMLAKKYQHLSVTDDHRIISKLDETPPPNLSKSGAIDSLLAQNEDLNARLKVLLKRLASIEEENINLTQEHREIKNQYLNLSDELSVYKEKESIWKERTTTAEQVLEIHQSQIRQKEVEFAKLRSQEWEMREHLKSRYEFIEKSYRRLIRFKSRITQFIKPRFKGMMAQIKELESRVNQYKRELQNTEIQCQTLINKNIEQVKKIKESLKKSEEERISLIAQFEQNHKDLSTEMNILRTSNLELRKKAGLLERNLERQDFLENKLIYAERENNDLRDQFNQEYTIVQNQMYEWRSKAQSQLAENESISQRYRELESQYARTKEITSRLDEQMESMRHLWKEKVHENERLKKDKDTLESLNADLSIQLNELRATLISSNNSTTLATSSHSLESVK